MHVCDGIVFDKCGMVVYSIMQEYQECEKIEPMSLISMQNTLRFIDNAPEGAS